LKEQADKNRKKLALAKKLAEIAKRERIEAERL